MNYEQFLKLARTYSFWRFTVKRQNNGSALVQIVDTFYTGNPKEDKLVLLDIINYQPNEALFTKKVLAVDFFTLYEKETVKPYCVYTIFHETQYKIC